MNVQRDVVLAPLTTIRLGGEAAHFVECGDVDDIREALAYAEGHNLAIHILGGGSNTIFHDQGFAGLVLAIRLSGVSFREEGEHVLVDVAAGEDWDDLVRACIERGLGGIECMSGVPGLVGATPIQNVGAYGQEVADTITQVTVFNRQTKETEILSVEECQLGYRTSRFKESDAGTYIVLEVQFRLLKDASPCVDYEQVQQAAQRKFGTVDFGKGKKALQIVRELVLDLRRMKSMVV